MRLKYGSRLLADNRAGYSVVYNMIVWLMLAFIAGCLSTSCASLSSTSHHSSPFLYPRAFFDSEEVQCLLDQATTMQVTTNVLWQSLSDKMSPEEFGLMLADPFISESLHVVRFIGLDSATSAVAFYEPLFKTSGWREQRGILALEYTDCGGDWLRVFHKGRQQVLLYICGDSEGKDGSMIIFKFRGISPDELLGFDYQAYNI